MENTKNYSCNIENNMCPYMKLAYAYVLPQVFRNLYSLDEALFAGTVFKDLNIPITEYGK